MMLKWNEYLYSVLKQSSSIDDLSFSSYDIASPIRTPPIIKASILMLEKMIAKMGIRNIFVFPEKSQAIMLFTITKLIYNIIEGKLRSLYNPHAFCPGEKLKYGNYIVEFLGIETIDGLLYIAYRTADYKAVKAPIDGLSMFERTNTNRRLSKYDKALAPKPISQTTEKKITIDIDLFRWMEDYRTYMESSVFFVAPLANARESIEKWTLNGKRLSDLMLIGQVNHEGKIRNINSGQLSGIPAIVLASDLYSVVSASEKNHPMQSIIIDISNTSAIINQMDALDTILKLDIPIVCITSTSDSTGLQPLISRNFNIWRWDSSSIDHSLVTHMSYTLDKHLTNCMSSNIEYIRCHNTDIGIAIKCILSHRNEVPQQSPRMMKIFSHIKSISFSLIRETMPLKEYDSNHNQLVLWECVNELNKEKLYLSNDTYGDYESAIERLLLLTSQGRILDKQTALEEYLLKNKFSEACIVVSKYENTRLLRKYWQNWCIAKRLPTMIHAMTQNEYISSEINSTAITIIVGWFNKLIMQKILFSNKTAHKAIMLYECEVGWNNTCFAFWMNEMCSSQNIPAVQTAFSEPTQVVSISKFESSNMAEEDNTFNVVDELDEVDQIIRESRFRQYSKEITNRSINEISEAIPVSFVGGYISFYRTTHKIISATRIIVHDDDSIDYIYPADLKIGDFVVVREADRDIIREMADTILSKLWKSHLRELSGKWKEALQIETLFHTTEEIYSKLVSVGCTRGYQTLRGWLFDEDKIAPSNKDDLFYIAKITDNKYMLENLDKIHDAAVEVRNAHTQAGMLLSQKLRSRIASALDQYGRIDPYNIYEPIELSLEDIGNVKIIKVSDIGSLIIVDTADTNRLIEE